MYIHPHRLGHPITTKPPFCLRIKFSMLGHMNNSSHTINQSTSKSSLRIWAQIVFGISSYLMNEHKLNPYTLIGIFIMENQINNLCLHILVAYVSECILSAIDLYPPRCVAKEYRTSRSLLYEWQSKGNKATVIPRNLSSVSRSLYQGRLLLRFDTLTGQREIYERFCVRKPKTKTRALEFKDRYSSRNPSVFYFVILPEFCYCDDATISKEKNTLQKVFRIGNRQSIAWLNIEHEARRELHLGFLFHGPDEVEFRNRQKKEPKVITISEESKMMFKGIRDLVRIASGFVGTIGV
jgi:hypothetical protein